MKCYRSFHNTEAHLKTDYFPVSAERHKKGEPTFSSVLLNTVDEEGELGLFLYAQEIKKRYSLEGCVAKLVARLLGGYKELSSILADQ
jgi:hypothetical protein